ncbi:TetR family transcriptional regulator [Lentibacillus kapialis]|uniref:TetR family transcriptional regulator n=1 Tax=Lentibacillus kapialis TaxID=340214 RepID=A0A917UZA7_9BACI|nr:TetR/AcrR family transcriptional regulator [Lentibacillus kapialis]GGK00018.1 TetR family transcriptional regulator [Lentibacillus kapialis]
MKVKKTRPLGRPRRSDRTQPTSELIIQAATRLFIEYGYQNVSVDDVAKQCDLTKATVYYHYDSKARLFTKTMVQMMVRIRERINTMLQESIPLKTRLFNITKAHLEATVNFDMDGFMKGVDNALTPEQLEEITNAETAMYQTIRHAFVYAMEQKEIRHINPTFATHAYLSLLKAGNYRNESDHPDTIDETAKQIIQLLWQGLQPEEEI